MHTLAMHEDSSYGIISNVAVTHQEYYIDNAEE